MSSESPRYRRAINHPFLLLRLPPPVLALLPPLSHRSRVISLALAQGCLYGPGKIRSRTREIPISYYRGTFLSLSRRRTSSRRVVKFRHIRSLAGLSFDLARREDALQLLLERQGIGMAGLVVFDNLKTAVRVPPPYSSSTASPTLLLQRTKSTSDVRRDVTHASARQWFPLRQMQDMCTEEGVRLSISRIDRIAVHCYVSVLHIRLNNLCLILWKPMYPSL